MALYVKDPEVSLLAGRLAELRKTTKTEAIKQALQHELEQEEKASYVDRAVAFSRMVRAKGNPQLGQTVDKAFIDSLYED
jgi:antitoxin VapB